MYAFGHRGHPATIDLPCAIDVMVSSRRSLRAVIDGAASLVISNPDHTKEGLRPTAAELIRVKRHKLPDAHRRPAGHPLHAVRQPVIPTRPVQLRHRQQMQGQMLRQSLLLQLPFPILGGMSAYVTSRF